MAPGETDIEPELYSYTQNQHLVYTIMGLIMLGVLLITLRAEMTFLRQSKTQKFQMVLSFISIAILSWLTLIWLLHWNLSPVFIFINTLSLTPILLIIAPIILWQRTREFKNLVLNRKSEHERLLLEVKDLIDERKREKIREGKVERGEDVDE